MCCLRRVNAHNAMRISAFAGGDNMVLANPQWLLSGALGDNGRPVISRMTSSHAFLQACKNAWIRGCVESKYSISLQSANR